MGDYKKALKEDIEFLNEMIANCKRHCKEVCENPDFRSLLSVCPEYVKESSEYWKKQLENFQKEKDMAEEILNNLPE